MNSTIKKAIALAKELNGERIYLANAVQRLLDSVLACEQPEPTKPDDEYEYHTTPGTVIQEGWEYENDLGWHRTGRAGEKIGDLGAMKRCRSKKVKQPEPMKWMPKAGEWATHSIQGYTSRIVRTAVENGHLFVWLERDDKLGIQSQILRQPTPSEISIAERRERLPPISPGMVWVVDRTEPPHPEAKFLASDDEWRRRPHPDLPYLCEHEYIKPAEPLADTASIPEPKAEPLMFTFYARMQEV